MLLFGVRISPGAAGWAISAVVIGQPRGSWAVLARALETMGVRSGGWRAALLALGWLLCTDRLPSALGCMALLVRRGRAVLWLVGLSIETNAEGSRTTRADGRGVG